MSWLRLVWQPAQQQLYCHWMLVQKPRAGDGDARLVEWLSTCREWLVYDWLPAAQCTMCVCQCRSMTFNGRWVCHHRCLGPMLRLSQVNLLLFDTGRLRDCNSQICCRRVNRKISDNYWRRGQFICIGLAQAHARPCSAGVPSWAVNLLVSDITCYTDLLCSKNRNIVRLGHTYLFQVCCFLHIDAFYWWQHMLRMLKYNILSYVCMIQKIEYIWYMCSNFAELPAFFTSAIALAVMLSLMLVVVILELMIVVINIVPNIALVWCECVCKNKRQSEIVRALLREESFYSTMLNYATKSTICIHLLESHLFSHIEHQ